MEPLTTSSRRSARRALTVTLVAAVVAWLLYVAGLYVDVVTTFDPSGAEAAAPDEDAREPRGVLWSQYLFVAAIAVFGLGAALARRRLSGIRAAEVPRSRLVDPVSRFAGVSSILAAVMAVWAVFTLFLGGLFSDGTDPEPVDRIANLYLPILLHAALVVAIVLAGFVLVPAASPQPSPSNGGSSRASSSPAGPPSTRARRTIALAYVTPIIAAAIALVLGLVVYDLTRAAPEAWIWAAILAIIGAGVAVGTVLASTARRGTPIASRPAPIAIGARRLNFALSIVFAVVVAGMSLGYGASAVYGLQAMPSLSLSVYSSSSMSVDPESEEPEYSDPRLSAYGSDLRPDSEGVLVLEAAEAETEGGDPDAAAAEVAAARVDRDRWLNIDAEMPELPAGRYELVARAVSNDARDLEVRLPLTVLESGRITLPRGSDASSDAEARLLPVTADWLLGELLPAGVMLGLGAALVALTTTVRHRDW